ncbi:MAG: hypothetical protein HRT36_05650 [Alphaproteobacteria bacterium]|nr:hypothetical protein [Alphaproteobacteria bacterium]
MTVERMHNVLSHADVRTSVPAPKRHGLAEIALWQFRHVVERFCLAPAGRSVLLSGCNGVGKTNILEAISLLSPGRGVRQASADQFLNRRAPAEVGWQIAARLDDAVGGYRIKTQWQAGQSSRTVLIEDSRVTQQSLGEYCRTLSLGPRDDQLFLQGAEGVRRFFDRLIAVFDPAHIGRVQALRQLQRQRREILESSVTPDPAWRRAIEKQLAAKLVVVSAARGQHGLALARVCAEQVPDFVVRQGAQSSAWRLRLNGGIQARLAKAPAIKVEEAIAAVLHGESSLRDGNNIQDVWSLGLCYTDEEIPVAQLSHGQQKIAILAMILAQAWLMYEELGIVPIVLLDEALSHLDQTHQKLLFAHLHALDCQYWLSGVEAVRYRTFAPDALSVSLSESQELPNVCN